MSSASAKHRRHRRVYANRNRNNDQASFFSQPVPLRKFLYLPEDREVFFMTLYFIFLPYITGLVFIYFFIAGSSIQNYLGLELTLFLPVWGIGYEVLAGIIMFSIFVSALRFYMKKPS